MKTLATKSLTLLLPLAFCLSAMAQQPQPDDADQDQPQENPTPAELLRQLVPQNGDTNGATQEALAELLRAALEAQQANGENRPDGENPTPQDARTGRPIRGQGTRGTMGSSTNAQPLASLLNGQSTNDNSKGLRLNFRNAPLSLVLDYLSDAAGLVISANSKVDLKGAVTVWSNQLVNRTEAIRLLNASLNSSGYAATVEGNLLNIYVVDATTTPIEVGIPDDYRQIPATKDLVTQIVYVRNVEPSQLIASLQPLMPAGTSMSANQGANAILITDTKANIRRMAQLVKALDTSSVSASEVRVIPLQYADATALAQIVTQLFQTDSNQSGRNRGGFGGFPGFGGFGGGDRGRGDNNSAGATQAGRVAAAKVTAVADERSNALVVSAPADQIEEIAELVDKMDVDVDELTELRVFRLRYADPQETADLLTNLFPDPTTQQNSRNQQFGFRFGPFGGAGGGDNNRNRNNSSPDSRSAKQTRVTAVPDPRTGSVIVSASQQMMGQIAGIIQDLDSDPSKQKKVYVIKVENRDPQEVVQELQSVISADSSANVNTRNNNNQSGQLNTRQQNNLQNQGNNSGFNTGFGNNTGTRTGR